MGRSFVARRPFDRRRPEHVEGLRTSLHRRAGLSGSVPWLFSQSPSAPRGLSAASDARTLIILSIFISGYYDEV